VKAEDRPVSIGKEENNINKLLTNSNQPGKFVYTAETAGLNDICAFYDQKTL